MSRFSTLYRKFWDRLRKAATVGELVTLTDEISRNATGGDLQPHEASLLEYCILERIVDVAAGGAEDATKLIIQHLVPYCLQQRDDIPEEYRSDYLSDRLRARELLKDWVQHFDDFSQEQICNALIQHLLPRLDGPHGVAASWILNQLGFGTEALFDALFRIAEVDEEKCKPFLYSLIACGAKPDDRMFGLVERLSQIGLPRNLPQVLRTVATPNRHVLLKQTVEQLEALNDLPYLHFALAVLVDSLVADFADDNTEFQDVWKILCRHKKTVLMDGRIVPTLNFEPVIPEMLKWLNTMRELENDGFRLWRITNRLFECHRPKQLDSWYGSLTTDSLSIVSEQAQINTGTSDTSRSIESEGKFAACKTLLMSGSSDTPQLLVAAYSTDEEWMLHRSIAKLSCGIQIDPMPPFVIQRIEEERNPDEIDSHEFAFRETALSIARSSGSKEAFDALLNFGFTLRGGVLLTWSETLSTVAYDLCRRDSPGIVEAIIEKLSAGQEPRYREAAARVLSFLGARSLLNEDVVATVLQGILDEDLPDYARADLVNSLHTLEFSADSETMSVVSTMTFSTDQPNLRLESSVFLIRQGCWTEYVDQFWQLIGWGRPEDIPAAPEGHLDDWKCMIVAELFLKDSTRFTNAMVFVLKNCDDDVCSRVCRSLRRGHEFPKSVVDCIETRLVAGTNHFSSPAYLFAALGHMDPSRLVSDAIWSHRDEWILGAKIGCIDAIREVEGQEETFKHEAIARLDALCGDSAVAVRRAANRAILAMSSEGDLITNLFKKRAEPKQPLWRHMLAAETLEFLPNSVRAELGADELEQLKYHRFRQVREQVEVSLKAALERDNAAHCRARLLSMVVGNNDEVLSLFPYGDALAQIGDLDDLHAVREFLTEHQELQLNARAWLQEIINQIAKRFKSNDNDISLGWNTIYESFNGQLSTGVGKLTAEFNLWRQPNANYREPGTWGGTAVLSEQLRLDEMFQIPDATIDANARKPGYVVVGRIQGMLVNLQGSGDYPLGNDDAGS